MAGLEPALWLSAGGSRFQSARSGSGAEQIHHQWPIGEPAPPALQDRDVVCVPVLQYVVTKLYKLERPVTGSAAPRVDRVYLLVGCTAPAHRLFSPLAHPWALPLPRAHERLHYLDRWGRAASHRERCSPADPPAAAPKRLKVRRKRRLLRWACHSSSGAAQEMHTTSAREQTTPRFPAGFRTIACIHTLPSRTLPPFRATPNPRVSKKSRLTLLSRPRADAQV